MVQFHKMPSCCSPEGRARTYRTSRAMNTASQRQVGIRKETELLRAAVVAGRIWGHKMVVTQTQGAVFVVARLGGRQMAA